jgi:hypothetical protein
VAFTTFSEFQNSPVSEKNILAIVEASKRIVGWSVHSGSVYKVAGSYEIVSSVEQNGTELTLAASVGAITAGKYYNDFANGYLYLQTSDSANPNGKFIAVTQRLFFSNAPLSLPYDLSTGTDVEWLPMIKDTSEFGVELDTKDQLGIAIEGKGSIKFHNDFAYWQPRYEKLTFENQRVFIYSYSRGLPANQAKLLYRGRITAKTYSNTEVSFTLNDVLNELRASPVLPNIEDYSGEQVSDSYKLYKQRTIYGYVAGFRPTNIDQELEDGRLLGSGTASQTQGSATVTGTSTQFLTHFNAGDEIRLDGGEFYSIESVDSDTQITLSEEASVSLSGVNYYVKGERPKRYLNRDFIIANHALREPSTTVTASSTAKNFDVADATDIEPGDSIDVNGEVVTVARVVGNNITTTTNLVIPPLNGDNVVRLSISNVRLGDKTLVYDRDYVYDASLGTLSLDWLAETNVAIPRRLTGTLTFTTSSRDVSGSGTVFDSQLKPGDWVKLDNQTEFFEVLQVVSSTALKLKTASTYTGTASGTFKSPDYYSEGDSVLVMDVLGKTEDGTTSGTFLKTAPQIVKDLCIDAGLTDVINTTSFTNAIDLAPQKIGLVIPEQFSDTKTLSYKEYISKVNRSVFASLIQNEDFELEYAILRPRRTQDTTTRIDETDILKWSIKSACDRIVSDVIVRYQKNEADPITGESFFNIATATTNNGQYLSKITKTYETETLLFSSSDAAIMAKRWAFFFDTAVTTLSVQSKLQLSRLQINDIVDVDHPRLYERVGSTLNRKISLVENISQDERGTTVDIVDMANAFGRVAVVMGNAASNFTNATDDELAYNGFFTDSYGMQSNDPDTYGINLIW